MKLWKVEAYGYEYDEYDSAVVRADSKSEAMRIAKELFEKHQLPISCEEIGEGESKIILSSFNAG